MTANLVEKLIVKSTKAVFREKVDLIDLEPIIYKLVNPEEGEGWSLEKADKVCTQYRDFLYLNFLHPNGKIVPTTEIDEFWHTHILDTRLYIVHCQELFGKYFHHFPYFGVRSEQDAQDLQNAFAVTLDLWILEIGYNLLKFNSSACDSKCTGSPTACGKGACRSCNGNLGVVASICNGCSSHCGKCNGEDVSSDTISLAQMMATRPRVAR